MKEETGKRRALGMGLEQLFNSEMLDFDQVEQNIIEETPKDQIVEININELMSNPYQPRKVFDDDALKELSDSIKEHGVFQPIIVRKSVKGYNIIAGERRVKASMLAGLTKIPAIIRDFTDEQMMEIAVLENLQRENLNAIEEAEAYNNLMKTLNLTQEELSKKVGKSRSHITNILGVLHLPEEVKKLVKEEKLTMGHARALSKLEDEEKIKELANKVIAENMNVRTLEEETKNEEKTKKIQKPKEKDLELLGLQKDLSEFLGTKVKVKPKKLEINYENKSDLNRILEIIKFTK